MLCYESMSIICYSEIIIHMLKIKKSEITKSIVVVHLISFMCLIENKYHVLQHDVCNSRSNCYIDPSCLYK